MLWTFDLNQSLESLSSSENITTDTQRQKNQVTKTVNWVHPFRTIHVSLRLLSFEKCLVMHSCLCFIWLSLCWLTIHLWNCPFNWYRWSKGFGSKSGLFWRYFCFGVSRIFKLIKLMRHKIFAGYRKFYSRVNELWAYMFGTHKVGTRKSWNT